MINQNIKDFILNLNVNKIPLQRKNSLNTIISELKKNNDLNLSSKLNFICTHNSRRSQLCQIWSEIIFNYYGFTRIHSFSGGTEVTNVNKRIIKILIESGFSIKQNKHISNPRHTMILVELTSFTRHHKKQSNQEKLLLIILKIDLEQEL